MSLTTVLLIAVFSLAMSAATLLYLFLVDPAPHSSFQCWLLLKILVLLSFPDQSEVSTRGSKFKMSSCLSYSSIMLQTCDLGDHCSFWVLKLCCPLTSSHFSHWLSYSLEQRVPEVGLSQHLYIP